VTFFLSWILSNSPFSHSHIDKLSKSPKIRILDFRVILCQLRGLQFYTESVGNMNHQQYRNNKLIISIVFMGMLCCKGLAQVCPPNIDFELGNFSSWQAYTGFVSAGGGQNTISIAPTAPAAGRHTLFSRANASNIVDEYGGFPVVCPNGSGYSVKLGNNGGGGQAEGISYEFTIPSNRNTYSLTYNYAVVFQDPNHREYEQPRLELEVMNISDNQRIDCSSFTFVATGSPLPGFYISPLSDSVAVWCKDWTAVTINLNGKAGKTIRLSFKTADCTFTRHFGYAYVDVNSECTGEFTGAVYCPADTAVTVVAPFGFQSYKWFNSNFSQELGNQQFLTLKPPPASGTVLAVEITPFDGFGCKDTLYGRLLDTLTIRAEAGQDAVYCPSEPLVIGENSKPGFTYQWTPSTGLSNPNISNPFASPLVTTKYYVTVTSGGGGCSNIDSVTITPTIVDTSMQFFGKTKFCSNTNDSAVLLLPVVNTKQWYKDGAKISGATQRRLRITQSGDYYAMVTNQDGCTVPTRTVNVQIEEPVKGITYPVKYTFLNTPLTLQARQIGPTVLWTPSFFIDNPISFRPVFRNGFETTQKYLVTLTSAAGCITVDTQVVKSIKEITVFVPNAFTPNNDRLNDLFFPVTNGIKEIYAFKVFNRWGHEVFSTTNFEQGWDGTLRGVPQLPGVYVWYYRGLGIDEKIFFRKGTITLIR
jgi:gliding motility-associated-like protein